MIETASKKRIKFFCNLQINCIKCVPLLSRVKVGNYDNKVAENITAQSKNNHEVTKEFNRSQSKGHSINVQVLIVIFVLRKENRG